MNSLMRYWKPKLIPIIDPFSGTGSGVSNVGNSTFTFEQMLNGTRLIPFKAFLSESWLPEDRGMKLEKLRLPAQVL